MIEILEMANSEPESKEIGSKAMNSLKLETINKENGGDLFFFPEQLSIPMEIFSSFILNSSPHFDQIQKLFNEIDNCDVCKNLD